MSALTAGAIDSLTGTTTTWSCVTAGHAGVFSSVTGCDAASGTSRAREGLAALAAPVAPGNLAGSVTGSTVTLTWLPPTSADPATSYVVEAGFSAGAANLASFDTGNSATTLTVAAVPSGTYYVRVRAKNSAGMSEPSNEIVLIVGASVPCVGLPGAPSGLTATVSGSSLTLTWNVPTGTSAPTGYLLEAGSSPGAADFASFPTGNQATTFTANVSPGTYHLRVRATNACGVSAPSNEVVVTVGSSIPPPVPPSVTGRWVGVAPAGMIADPGSNECPVEWDLQMDLTLSGTTVTGTAITRNRRVQFHSCSGVFGFVATYGVNGTVGSGGTIAFTFGTGSPAFTFSGSFSATRMSGRFVGPNSQPGSFTVNRQ